MTGCMDQLQCLHDEFDVANAAPAKFDVTLQVFRSNEIALDALLDVSNFVQQFGSRAFRINKWLMLSQEFVGQFAAASDAACLNKCQPFPSFTEPSVIIFHALERPSQRTCRAFRPQAQIDPKKRTRWMGSRKRFEDFFSQAVEELVM